MTMIWNSDKFTTNLKKNDVSRTTVKDFTESGSIDARHVFKIMIWPGVTRKIQVPLIVI